jgi:cystathionine beta-lyase/cystathionine gamma-synthase
MNRVRLITLAVSLGGVESLIEHPASMTHKSIPDAQREAEGVTPGLVRLSVGCEDLDDIRADLAQALDAVRAALDEVPATEEA